MKQSRLYLPFLGITNGIENVYIYLSKDRARKLLPKSRCTKVCKELLSELYTKFGEDNVKVTEKSIEKNSGHSKIYMYENDK